MNDMLFPARSFCGALRGLVNCKVALEHGIGVLINSRWVTWAQLVLDKVGQAHVLILLIDQLVYYIILCSQTHYPVQTIKYCTCPTVVQPSTTDLLSSTDRQVGERRLRLSSRLFDLLPSLAGDMCNRTTR